MTDYNAPRGPVTSAGTVTWDLRWCLECWQHPDLCESCSWCGEHMDHYDAEPCDECRMGAVLVAEDRARERAWRNSGGGRI